MTKKGWEQEWKIDKDDKCPMCGAGMKQLIEYKREDGGRWENVVGAVCSECGWGYKND